MELLRQLTDDPAADFRPNQLETIERLVGRRERVLLDRGMGTAVELERLDQAGISTLTPFEDHYLGFH